MGFAAKAQTYIMQEDFSSLTTGTNLSSTGPSSTVWAGNDNFPTVVKAYPAGGVVKFGTSSLAGSITSKALDLSVNGGNFNVSLDVKGWSAIEGPIVVTVSGLTPQSLTYTAVMTSTSLENKILTFTGGTANSTVTIETTTKRAYIDNVNVYYTAASTCTASNLAFSSSSVSKIASDIAFTQTATSLNVTTAITYSSSAPSVATVNATSGEITVVSAGEATITATQAAGTSSSVNYCAATANYTLNVSSSTTTPTITVTEVSVPAFSANAGNSATQTIHVSGLNLTEDITLLPSGADAGLFTLSQNSIAQDGGSAQNTAITITYRPTSAGTHAAILTLTSAAANAITLNLNGTATDLDANPYGLDASAPTSFIDETFESVAAGTTLPENWINASVQGTKTWVVKLYKSNLYSEMTAYNATDGVQQTLLISPAINFDQIVKNNVSFGWIAGYAKVGTTLKVYIMTLDGTKTEVKSINATEPTAAYASTYTNETLDLSAFNGIAFLVFEYNGNSTALTTTYQVDNVKVISATTTTTTTADNLTDNINISAYNGKIEFSSKQAGETVEIYNAIGQKLASSLTVEGLNTIPVATRGVVIVKIGKRVSKVIL